LPNISEVAKRAGVAPITVSRVVNNNGYVSAETRQRVETAIQELNYIPNSLGPSLRSKRTETLALVLSDLTNPFWTSVARGVEDAANKQGYHIIIGNTDESPTKQKEYLKFLLKKQVDGFLIVPTSLDAMDILHKQSVPFVVLDRRISGAKFDTVRCESLEGAYRLTKHLLELGHRQMAIVTGRQDHSTAADRVAGFVQALEEAGIKDSHQIYWGEYHQESGYEATQKFLQSEPRPTAIFAANNLLAIGVMRALREAQLRVPEDISVVAFDDLPLAITIDPFFTVAMQPAYEMGYKATELLLSRLNQDEPGTKTESSEIILPVEIIIRRSSGKPPT
jgi:LacI family transcriptional regulator